MCENISCARISVRIMHIIGRLIDRLAIIPQAEIPFSIS